MFNKAKTEYILKGRELLRVNSLQKPLSKRSKNALMIFAALIYIMGMGFGYWTSTGDSDLMLTWTVILTSLYGLNLIFVFYLGNAKGKPLIITERGIVAPPSVAERWEDIESYGWDAFKGLNKVPGPTVFSACEGVCLRLINKGLFQRSFSLGGNIFITYLIFFSPEQIAIADNIFNQHGIKKQNIKS